MTVYKKKIFKILLLSVIVLLVLFLFFIPLLVKSYLIDSFKKMNLENPQLTIRHVGINQLDIRHLTLGTPGNPSLIIPSLDVDFSWLDLLKGKIRKIEITGMKLKVAVDKEGFTIKGLEPLFKNKGKGKPALAVYRVDIGSSIVQVDWEGRTMSFPFTLSAVTERPGEPVTFSIDLTPHGNPIAVKGILNMDSGTGAITIAGDHADLEKYFSDFNITFFQWLKSRVQLHAEINVKDWGIRDSRISLATPAFSAGFPGVGLKGSVSLAFRLNRQFQPEDVKLKLKIENIAGKDFKIDIPFDLDIGGSRLSALQFKLAPLRLQQPPGIRFEDFSGTASLDTGQVQVQGYYRGGIDADFVSWLFPGIKMKGKLEFKGNIRVLANNRTTDWNLDGKGQGKVFLSSKDGQAGVENLAVSIVSAGRGDNIKIRLDVELKGVEIKYKDLVFSTPNLFSQNTIEKTEGKNRTAGGKLKIATALVKQKKGIAAGGVRIDVPWHYPFTGPNPNTGNWGIASLKLGDIDVGKISGEVIQKGTGIQFSGEARTPVESLKMKMTGTCQWLEDGIEGLLQVEIPGTQISKTSQLGLLHPALAGYRCKGHISGLGTVAFSPGNLNSSGLLKLHDLEMETDTGGIKFRGINAEITFKDLPDFRTAVSQRIDFTGGDISGMQINAGHLVFETISADSFYIEGGEFAFCGGKISVQPLRFDLKGEDLKITLYGDRINFAEMVNALQGDKIASGEAELNGMLTIGISDGIPIFRDGHLYTTPGVGGNIKFIRSEVISGGVLLVEEAIKDFNYDWIKLKLDTVKDKLNMTAFINGVPARRLPLTYDNKRKDIVRDKGGNLELKGLLLELRFTDLDLKRLMKGGIKIYSQEKKMP